MSLITKILEETVTLTIPTQLVQKHAENIFPGNGISITNFNILEKTSPPYNFPIPYLATFSIAGSRTCGLMIVLPFFRGLQTIHGVSRFTN